MEVIKLYSLKEQHFSLREIGYPEPLDEVMAEDLLLLRGFIAKKQNSDMKTK